MDRRERDGAAEREARSAPRFLHRPRWAAGVREMKRRSHDEAEMRRRVPTADEQFAGTMFSVERRDVRLDPPSVPVESSERGAEHVKPRAEDQRMAVLAVLARLPSGHLLSRDEINE